MAGTLYLVATPIGNLDDMPPRVAATFAAADFVRRCCFIVLKIHHFSTKSALFCKSFVKLGWKIFAYASPI